MPSGIAISPIANVALLRAPVNKDFDEFTFPDTMAAMESRDQTPLKEPVFCDDHYKPFGEITADDARRQGSRLGEAGGWGPLVKVAGVANAWRELAAELDDRKASCVSDLPPESVLRFAKRVWVVPPRGTLL